MKLTTTSIYPAFMAIMLLAAGLVLSDVASPLRAALGLAAVLLIPGYMLMGALIPSSETLGWKTRLGVSLAISVALQPLLAVLLNVTVGNIARNPMVYGLTAFSLVAGG
ncbi:MAG: DUF1616 domain-containing protein, partial [Chloroflexi bacterium]|nr:DUF1616 domain-containing protein [Chloroflexota bacterium]